MRIGIVTETYLPEVNGVALTVAGLVRGLADAGHQVHLVRPRQASDSAWSHTEQGVSTELMRGIGLPGYPGLQFGLPAGRRLRALWKKQRPDAIYVATEGPLGASALRTANLLAIPASTGFHTRFDEFAKHYRLGALAPLVMRYLRKFHGRGAATFVPTFELVDFLLRQHFGNVVRLPRAVDTRLFAPSRRDDSLRAQWGLAAEQLAVIYVGRIAHEKNLPLAVRSFRALQQRLPHARYVWVGDGPARAVLQAENPDFIFAGVQRGEALARHYASADLFMFPSLTETFGNVTLEALASGVPTLAFDYGAAREHVDDSCGKRIAFGNAEAFVQAACELATDCDRLSGPMRSSARAAVEDLDPGSVSASFIAALAHLARAAREPHASAAGLIDEPGDMLARRTS